MIASFFAQPAKCCRVIHCGGVTEAMLGTRLFGSSDFSASLSTRCSRRILAGVMPEMTGSMMVSVGAMQPQITLRAS